MAAWKQPLLAVDVVLVRFRSERGLEIGTAERAAEPARGEQALPGVLVRSDESLTDAASRAVGSKAGIADEAVRHLDQLHVFDTPGREASTVEIGRERSWSLAFLGVVDPAATTDEHVRWHAASVGALGLPFDHDDIVDFARQHIRSRLWSDVAMTRALTGDSFPTRLGADLEAAATGVQPHASNFHRRLTGLADLARLDEKSPSGGRPAHVWKWRRP